MALNDVALSSTATIDILHPRTHLPIGFRITVYGPHTEEFQKITRRQQNKRLERAKRNRGQSGMTAEELEAEGLELLVGITKAWESDIERDGEKAVSPVAEISPGEFLECTPDNVRRIYTAPSLPWIRRQVDQGVVEDSNFLQS